MESFSYKGGCGVTLIKEFKIRTGLGYIIRIYIYIYIYIIYIYTVNLDYQNLHYPNPQLSERYF